MTTASDLIKGALRLINVPGRGASLAAEDQSNALSALQELLNTNAVSKQFTPGIKRHFFTLNQSKAIYTYGAGSQFDFRSDAFGSYIGDPAAFHIEGAYIRQGSVITNNELVSEYRFGNLSTWILSGGMTLANDQLSVQSAIGAAIQSLPLADLTGGTTYTLRMSIEVNAGSALVQLRNNAVAFDAYTLDSSGNYEFDFVWPAGTLPDVRVASTAVDDFAMTLLSIVPRGVDRLSLPDGQGTDYPVRIIDQTTYNRWPVKGSGGTNYAGLAKEMLYSRAGGQAGEIRFDSPASNGDILVMDVITNSLQIDQLDDELWVNPEAMLWLRYALANLLAGEYGKALRMDQVRIMENAWTTLSAGQIRYNNLRVDPGLAPSRRFSVRSGESF